MNRVIRRTEDLAPADLAECPVWEYLNYADTQVTPVYDIPVSSLIKRIVGTELRLHNGTRRYGILTNVRLNNFRQHEQGLCVWVEKNGKWFELARYHDSDYEKRSHAKLAQFLGLSMDEVYPITYDIAGIATGLSEVIRGVLLPEPRERLSLEQLTKLALEPSGDPD
jgi:hypothetical protein